MNAFACWIADKFASGVAVILFVLACVALKLLGFSDVILTFALSVLAITMTQLLLIAQNKDTKAIQLKLDGLIEASEAANELAGVEKRL